MKDYKLTAKITISIFTIVKANSLEEAKEKAEDRVDMMQISSNNGDSPYYSWMVDELDGTPFDIEEA